MSSQYKVSFPRVASHCAVCRVIAYRHLINFVKEQIHCFLDGIGEAKPLYREKQDLSSRRAKGVASAESCRLGLDTNSLAKVHTSLLSAVTATREEPSANAC